MARALLTLPTKAEWSLRAETVDEKLERFYVLRLDSDAVKTLVGQGAIPDSSDLFSGMGTVSRTYVGRTLRTPTRSIEVRMYDDPRSKLPARFEIEIFQSNMRAVGGMAIGIGQVLPVPRGKRRPAGPKEKLPLYLSTTLFIRDAGKAKLALDEDAQALLGKN